MMQITIPKPCHEDWNAMTANEQGRHCTVCCKTVIDFTAMTDEEVQYFFLHKRKEEAVCGRFKNEQLHRIRIELPYNIYTIVMPLWKRFLTACLLAFSSMLFSCDALVNDTMGQSLPFVVRQDSTVKQTPPPPAEQVMLGGIALPEKLEVVPPGDSEAMGDIEVVETGTSMRFTIEPPAVLTTEPSLMGEPAIETTDSSTTMIKGKIAVDTGATPGNLSIDTINQENKEQQCDNKNISL